MNPKFASLLIATALFPGLLQAQSSNTDESEEIPSYDVEIVIFKNIKAPKSREFVLPVSSPTRDEKLLDLSSPRSIAAAGKLNYKLLSAKDYRLLDVVAKLNESARYELLLHAAWRQPGLELKKAMPIWVRGGRIFGNEYTSIDSQIEFFENEEKAEASAAEGTKFEFDEQSLESQELLLLEKQTTQLHPGLYELEGKITITLSRYLHAYTDLVLRRPRLSADTIPNSPAQDRYLATHSADMRILNNHSLKEHRRMRSKNLHYLDNPEFAMLILITPYKLPPTATPSEAPGQAEPTAAAQ